MQKHTIEKLFDDLNGEFDVNVPNENHELRFLNKLKANDGVADTSKNLFRFKWKPFLVIAASVVIFLSVFMTFQNKSETLGLASVSPELAKTQNFFTTTIENELKKLNKERSPLTKEIITDAIEQIKLLEKEYVNLQKDLNESGQDQRVIYAMITNFQNRIDILNTVLEEIKTIKTLKTTINDTKNTL